MQHHSGVVELIESKVKMTGDQSEDDWSQPLFLRNAKLYALHDSAMRGSYQKLLGITEDMKARRAAHQRVGEQQTSGVQHGHTPQLSSPSLINRKIATPQSSPLPRRKEQTLAGSTPPVAADVGKMRDFFGPESSSGDAGKNRRTLTRSSTSAAILLGGSTGTGAVGDRRASIQAGRGTDARAGTMITAVGRRASIQLGGGRRTSLRLTSAEAPLLRQPTAGLNSSLNLLANGDDDKGPSKHRKGTPLTASELVPLSDANLSTAAVEAGKAFNARHCERCLGARHLLEHLRTPSLPQLQASVQFDAATREVRRNRLTLAEERIDHATAKATPPPKRRRRPKSTWHLTESIFAPRQETGNSSDFFETDLARASMFTCDWELLKDSHGLSHKVRSLSVPTPTNRSDADNGSDARAGSNGGSSGGAGTTLPGQDGVDAVQQVLKAHHELLYGCFDYYSAAIDAKRTERGEYEIWSLSLLGYTQFCRDACIYSWVPLDLLDLIWHQVKAEDRKNGTVTTTSHGEGKGHTLVRHQFLQAVVRIATAAYVGMAESKSFCKGSKGGRGGKSADRPRARSVAEALEWLCAEIEAGCPPEVHQDSNSFRRHRCYSEQVDLALRRHQDSLKRIFLAYSSLNLNLSDEFLRRGMMSVGEWVACLEHLGFFETRQITLLGAKLIFKWSIIRGGVAANYHTVSVQRLRNLHFEDFLEALVRIACIIALPTDWELSEAGAQDAGDFLLALYEDGKPDELERFVETRRVSWMHEPAQRVESCVTHLLSVVVRTIEENTSRASHGKVDIRLTKAEVAEFLERRVGGMKLGSVPHPGGIKEAQARASLLNSIRAAARVVREKLLKALRAVDIFKGLGEGRILTLADAFSDATFAQGEWIFEQGDEGDQFYVVIDGRALVTRFDVDPDTGDEVERELAVLETGHYFGERALLKNQTRYAGVKVDSESLHSVTITRTDFEAALGGRLDDLVPDHYKLDHRELVSRLRSVHLFDTLTMAQLELMVECMTEEHYHRGDYVFREGDAGETMYVIIKGTAQALRTNPETGLAESIGVLGLWGFFGERALLRSDTRYASIQATSPELSLYCMSRTGFEAALGAPLDELIVEQTYSPKARGGA